MIQDILALTIVAGVILVAICRFVSGRRSGRGKKNCAGGCSC